MRPKIIVSSNSFNLKLIMEINNIGANAGLIWNALNANGKMTESKLKKETGLGSAEFYPIKSQRRNLAASFSARRSPTDLKFRSFRYESQVSFRARRFRSHTRSNTARLRSISIPTGSLRGRKLFSSTIFSRRAEPLLLRPSLSNVLAERLSGFFSLLSLKDLTPAMPF